MAQIKNGIIEKVSENTLRVRVNRVKIHPIYKKRYRVSKYYLVDVDKLEEFKVGDKVKFTSTRPISKNKAWKVIK